MRIIIALVAIVILSACKEASKEKELVELREKVAKMESAKPSLSSVRTAAAPEIQAPKREEAARAQSSAAVFELNVKGQLDRIAAEIAERDNKISATPVRPHTPMLERDYKILGIKKGARPDDIAWFVERSDANKNVTYQHLMKNAARYAGMPWKTQARILEIEELPGPVTVARISVDYFGNSAMYVFGRFDTDFVQHDAVDIMGYLADTFSYQSQAGWNITIPAMSMMTMTKLGGISKLRSQYAKDAGQRDVRKRKDPDGDDP